MRLLVTGAGGFIGSHLLKYALLNGFTVFGVELPRNLEAALYKLTSIGASGARLDAIDVTHHATMVEYIASTRPDIIVHAAGITGKKNNSTTWTDFVVQNVNTVAALIQAVAFPGKLKPVLIFLGTQFEYGSAAMPWHEESTCLPLGAYGASKLAATEVIRAAIRSSLIIGCVCRLAVVYGPGQPVGMLVPDVITHVLRGKPLRVMNPGVSRQFLYVSDVAKLVIDIGIKLGSGLKVPDVLNLPATDPLRVETLVKLIMHMSGASLNYFTDGAPSDGTGALNTWLDDSKARALGFNFMTPLEHGLGETFSWYKNNPQEWDI